VRGAGWFFYLHAKLGWRGANSKQYPIALVKRVVVPPFADAKGESDTYFLMTGLQGREVNGIGIVVLVNESMDAFVRFSAAGAKKITNLVTQFN
jgi:hypothetical protein